MKLFLILLFTFSCFAENYICLVDKTTSKVSDISYNTAKNRITWDNLKGTTKDVKYFSMDSIPDWKNKLWNGTTVINDDAQDALDLEFQKDINNINKLEKAGFLVIMDYLRAMGCTKTNNQFKQDVITKYDSL